MNEQILPGCLSAPEKHGLGKRLDQKVLGTGKEKNDKVHSSNLRAHNCLYHQQLDQA